MNIQTVSVKVMRSHDYCHFEVALSATAEPSDDNAQIVASTDELRKTAARLADKAVEQYKIAKANRYRLQRETRDRGYELREIESIKETAETDRTPEQQAKLKAHADEVYEASRRFDYEDRWDDDEGEDS